MSLLAIVAVVGGVDSLPPAHAGELPAPGKTWTEVESEHFTFITNASRRRAVQAATNLERFRQTLLDYTRGMEVQSPLPTIVYLFDDERSFAPYNLVYEGEEANTAGYFVPAPDGNYVALDLSGGALPYNVIYHEYLHYVLDNNLPDLPVWLNEGLAEFYSTFRVLGKKTQIGLVLEEHLYRLRGAELMSLPELFAVTHSSPEYNEADRQSIFYAQSWGLVHYLAAGDEKMAAGMSRLLGLFRQGAESAEAVETAYGISREELTKKWIDYIGAGQFGGYTITAEEPVPVSDVEWRELDYAETLFRLGDLLAHNSTADPAAAEAHLTRAIELDPAMGQAWIARAANSWQSDKLDEAETFAKKALAFREHPERALSAEAQGRAHALYGLVLMDRFHALGEEEMERQLAAGPTPPLILAAREQFRGGLAALPDHLECLTGLATSYVFGNDADVSEGLRAITRATHLNPARNELLAQKVVLTARSGNTAGARALLDRALRHRGTAEEITHAEVGLLQYAYRQAHEKLESGALEAAIATLRGVDGDIRDPGLRHEYLQRLAMLQEAADFQRDPIGNAHDPDVIAARTAEVAAAEPTGNFYLDLFNEAARQANSGDIAGGLEKLERVIAESEQDDLILQARTAAMQMRTILHHNGHVDRYNEAIDHANGGRFSEAVTILEAILEDDPDQETRRMVDSLLEQLAKVNGE